MALRNPAAFFAACRSAELFGSTMFQAQVTGCEVLLRAFDGVGWPIPWVAYGLATSFHETAHSMRPREEIGDGRGRAYGVIDESGKAPYGRGFVQLTWRTNYIRADQELRLGGHLSGDYDVALIPAIASDILVHGMAEGWFTGKKLSDYLPSVGLADRTDFVDARRVINGSDRADMIAGFALAFQSALKGGGWAV